MKTGFHAVRWMRERARDVEHDGTCLGGTEKVTSPERPHRVTIPPRWQAFASLTFGCGNPGEGGGSRPGRHAEPSDCRHVHGAGEAAAAAKLGERVRSPRFTGTTIFHR